MKSKIEYEQIDLSNVKHVECLSEVWADDYTKEYYCGRGQTLEQFLSTFNNESTARSERLVKRNDTLVGWIRAAGNHEALDLDYIILRKFRELGCEEEVLEDFLNRNNGSNIKIEVRKDDYRTIQALKAFEFSVESKPGNEMLIYRRLSRKS
jgi:hypothetical protein